MKKKTLLISLSLAAMLTMTVQPSFAQQAEGKVISMVLTHTDGTVTKFALNKQPVVTHEGENVLMTCDGQSLSTPMRDIERWTFEEEDLSAIALPSGQEPQADFSFTHADFSGLKAGDRVTVFGIDGKAHCTVKAGADGQVSIDLAPLPQGVYVLRTPGKSYKIKK